MNYFDLIRELAITDFKLKYQGSVLGYLWSFMKPLALFVVLYVVFTHFIKIGGDVPYYPVYLLLGIVLWSYFTDSTSAAMSSIVDRADLIRKVYFPRIVIIIAASISSLITLLLNMIVIAIFILAAGIRPDISALLVVFLIIELYVLSLGASLLLSALYVKFRDFRHIWELGLQIMFYASPIIYPLAIVPAIALKPVALSPITQIIQDARFLVVTPSTLTTAKVFDSSLQFVPYVIPFIILAIGYAYFKRAAAQFAEEL